MNIRSIDVLISFDETLRKAERNMNTRNGCNLTIIQMDLFPQKLWKNIYSFDIFFTRNLISLSINNTIVVSVSMIKS